MKQSSIAVVQKFGATDFMSTKTSEANRLCLSAIEIMHRTGITPEPHNYELFYLYKSEKCSELTKALDELIDSGEKVTQFHVDHLRKTFVATESQSAEMAALGDRLSDQINEAIDLVKTAADSTSSFSGSLDEAGSQLNELSDPQKLATVVASLIVATENLGHSSLELDKQLKATSKKVEQLQGELGSVRHESQVDALTGVGNRRYFDVVLTKEVGRAKRHQQPLCLCLLDIDHFKKFNDTFGHTSGDAALRCVAGLLKDQVRGEDLVARFGGEEFVVVLPNTSLPDAFVVIERIRKSFAEKHIKKRSTGQSMGNVTASFGIVALDFSETTEMLIERADRCLYAAKHAGRNRIETDSSAGIESQLFHAIA